MNTQQNPSFSTLPKALQGCRMSFVQFGGSFIMKIDSKKPNYIYFLTDPNDNMVRYIGVTNSPNIRFVNHLKEATSMGGNTKNHWIKNLLKEDKKPRMLLVAKFTDRIECEKVERQLIKDFCKIQTIYNRTYVYGNENLTHIVKLSDL